jgi:hypothetical protein
MKMITTTLPGKNSKTFTFAALVLASAVICARAEDTVKYKAKAIGSKVTIAGGANIHDWTMEGSLIAGTFEVPASVDFDQSKAALTGVTDGKLAAKAETTIDVASLHGNWSGMDSVMQDAMDAKAHPTINYHLMEMTPKEHAAGAPFQFDTKGQLVVKGVTNVISMPVSIENTGAGKLKISGKVPLKMTDYKVTPPTKLGLFKTHDDMTISFEWVVGKVQAPKAQ